MIVQMVHASVDRYTVDPSEIDSDRHFFGVFGSIERALTATIILKVCQTHGRWTYLPEADLLEQTQQRSKDFLLKLQEMLDAEMLIRDELGKYHVTNAFVRACYFSQNTPPYAYVAIEAPQDGATPA